VAVFFVSTFTIASANKVAVIRIRPKGISVPPIRKLNGVFHSRSSGRLYRSTNTERDFIVKLQTTPKAYAWPSIITFPRLRRIVYDLERHNQVNEPGRGAVPRVRLAEPIWQHAILRNAVENAIRSDNGRIHGAGQNQRPNQNDEGVEDQLERDGANQKHREAPDQIVEVFRPLGVGNEHHGEERDRGSKQQAIKNDHEAGPPQVFEFRRFDLAVDLRQRFEATHGQQRVSEADQPGDRRDRRRPGTF